MCIDYLIGNCLIRPVIPAYLGSIAPKGRSAEYIAINATFSNLGMMSAANLTQLFSVSPTFAILSTGGIGVLNGLIMFAMVVYTSAIRGSSAVEVATKPRTPLEEFFGFGDQLSEKEFWEDVVETLKTTVVQRNYSRAVRCVKGQALVKELLLNSLPELPDQFEPKMEALYNLYLDLGHDDWAADMTG